MTYYQPLIDRVLIIFAVRELLSSNEHIRTHRVVAELSSYTPRRTRQILLSHPIRVLYAPDFNSQRRGPTQRPLPDARSPLHIRLPNGRELLLQLYACRLFNHGPNGLL